MELKFNSIEEVREFITELDPARIVTDENKLASALARVVTFGGYFHKIAAIKVQREATGCSLVEAKKAIERFLG